MIRRILFVSFASYLDDANGAAVASRAMMEALARRGFAVEVLCGPIREQGREIDLASARSAHAPFDEPRRGGAWDVGAFGIRSAAPDHLRLDRNGVPVTI